MLVYVKFKGQGRRLKFKINRQNNSNGTDYSAVCTVNVSTGDGLCRMRLNY